MKSREALAAWRAENLCDLTGRVAVVTGANSGIGFEVAWGLCERGADLVLACRNGQKAAAAASRLAAAFPAARIETLHLDLSSLASMAAFARELGARYQKIHIIGTEKHKRSYIQLKKITQGSQYIHSKHWP